IEWLVDNAGGNLSEQKERYQQLLEDIGISKWASRTLRSIGYARRMLVLLLASSLHSSKLVLFNDPHFALEPKDEMVARRIFKHLHDSGKTVMIASSDLFTLQSVANRVLILKNGAAAYTGSFKDFLETYSGVSVSFPQEYTEAVKAVTDDRYVLLSAGEGCTLSMKKGEKGSTTDLVHLLESAGVPTESIRNTEKTFALACREVL
ncbi:MAG: hypothetical protein IJ091_00830, partial [Oscillospiraceae bacterium]|nr:hypothetical protein [Oscillospiraceae bacterium]